MYKIRVMIFFILLLAFVTSIVITLSVKTIFLTWLFALITLFILCVITVKYWVELIIVGLILKVLGWGLVFAFATSLLWMTAVDSPMGPKGELLEWGWYFSFFYILWCAMWGVGVLVYYQIFDLGINFIRNVFKIK